MPTKQTDVKVKLTPIGFAQAQRELGRLHKANQKAVQEQLKGTKASQEEIQKLRSRLKDLTETQTALMKAMSQTGDAGSKAYKELERTFKSVEREGSRVERTIRRMEQAIGDTAVKTKDLERTMARGGFTQGLLQGAMPGGAGAFIQRGPGMQRQVAGQLVGRAARGVGGGIVGTPFGGIQSIVQGLQSIPGGGLIGAPLGMAAQHAGSALQFQRQMLQAGPGLAGMLRRPVTAGMRRRAAEAGAATLGQGIPEADILAKMGGNVEQQAAAENVDIGEQWWRKTFSANPAALVKRRMARGRIESQMGSPEKRRREAEFQLRNERSQEAYRQSINQQRRAGQRRLAAEGVGLGMSLQDVVGLQTQITRMGGGGGTELLGRGQGGQGLGRVAMAAQQRYQLGPEVAAQFLRAGRRGGLVGGAGRSGEAMTEAIKEGIQLGLEGSELNDYMATVADGISQWQSTGIPFNKEALQTFSAGFANMGLGAIQGGRVGRGVMGGVQRIGAQGAQTAMQFAMMRQVGGLQSLRPEDVLNARIRMSELQGAAQGGNIGQDTVKFLQEQVKGAGGVRGYGSGVLESMLGEMGVQVSPRQLKELTQRLETGGAITPDLFTPEKAGRGPQTPEGLIKSAEEFVAQMAPNLRKQAAIANQQLASGQNMLNAVQKFEEAQTKIVGQFSKLGPALETVADGAVGLAESIPKVVEGFQKMAAWFAGKGGDMIEGHSPP